MGARTWPHLLSTVLSGTHLSAEDTAWAMGEIMAGEATPAQVAGFAVALRAKGVTPEEVAGLVEAMVAHAVQLPGELPVAADIVGTGGDQAHTVNISTMAALVVAGGGVPVVKHGNRAASSKCGSADLIEALGVPLDLSPEAVVRCVREAGIGFCFAARFHAGMRHAAATRRELGIPTFFNFLGPLTNPARPKVGAIGCADETMAPVMAGVIARRGGTALVLRGVDGLDEFTTTSPTQVWLAHRGEVTFSVIDAVDLGLPRVEPVALRGDDAAFNMKVTHELLAGRTGPVRDAVVLNAAAAFAAHEGLHSTDDDWAADLPGALRRGLVRAAHAIDSGDTERTLARWVEVAGA
ncbi:anthranilate phosphoribosyltransferase [Phytomonospora endophytica]|uniref:Anthranilate phosphoribosyltransferase n=1 Tax=Phytomonospora endophytica TaxID=714109 RepID=A0A841FGM2_9ACTN|nr:anthranilate phosphoribosyltransferase [Phytomonospora endophytica]MBB6034805.1 anthranilate phosphoribosyltransferase [Phytomonospora endophytica]GIG68992.1 anthranilate phosphoribosyltransferase 1 [Phytomonospora endophytica]